MNAADIMSTRLVTAAPDTPVLDLVRLMLERHVKAVPIVAGERLLGLVTQADVIRALASREGATSALADPDRRIREAFLAALGAPPWSESASNPTCLVDGGIVNLWGPVDSAEDRAALVELARSLPGVRGVEDHMTVLEHDPTQWSNWPAPFED